ncbi:cytochrome P450 [Macroventuria anomochaeta]|uniref:Cytochrome P450 n=1 Tax=Macroventuria anomochaeta TaxID=301207 RepID=A0ACB6S537_9PLEO|nr:cytochrome P450 [Macroventuria anomochaeta]KAF2628750.1 cytochrome P450 [Macroventuria anomochaeta]
MLSLSTLVLLAPLLFLLRITISYLSNPVRKIPAAHPLAPFTGLWISSIRWRQIENATLKDAHDRLGPIVCLGPREISVNCVKGGIKDVYAGGFEKRDARSGYNWYGFFTNFGNGNMFSTGLNKLHSARKRMLSNIYSKSVVNASPALQAQVSTILYQRLLPCLASLASGSEKGVFEASSLLSASTMDIVTSYMFGLKAGSNLIEHPSQLLWFLDLYKSRHGWNFWPQEYPRLTSFLKKWLGVRLSPKWVDGANAEIEKWTKNMCDGAAGIMQQGSVKTEETPSVYQQLSAAVAKDAKKNEVRGVDLKPLIASEMLDHLAAGFDTSAITLTYVVHELSTHKDIQSRLQNELQTLSPRVIPSSQPNLPDPKTVDALPVLHAVIWETLRLHSAIPGPQPRFSPPQGCQLGPNGEYFVPGGVRVSASAGILHQNEEVYERASEWRPERWLDLDKVDEEKRKDMESRWFWAFGSGGRMCVGSHLAVYQMKYIVAALYSNYSTTVVDDTGIQQSDSYTAPPKGDKLLIQLEKLEV